MLKKAILTLTVVAISVAAQAQERTETIRFAPGANGATIQGSITGYESVSYTLGAEAGQRMTIRLDPSNLATYFNLYAPGRGPGDEALVNAQFTGAMVPDINVFDGTLPSSGQYIISVYMMRSAARRNETSTYGLSVSIEGALPSQVEGDYADGLQGGPDFYRVATARGGSLNLRAAPTAGASVVVRLADGQNVRNLGCRMAEGRRWCRVATLADPGSEGWAAGDFLVEGTGQVSPPRPPAGGSPAGGGMARVTGVAANDVLNLRSGPGTSYGIVGALANGDAVQNLGCQAQGNARWCRVRLMDDMGGEGWVNGRFLTGGGAARPPAQRPPAAGSTAVERVRFAAGTSGANLSSSLLPGQSRRYVLGASNGQDLYVHLTGYGPDMYYQIFNPDGSLLLGQMMAAREYRGQLWQSGDHVVEVINRGNGAQSYDLYVGIQ